MMRTGSKRALAAFLVLGLAAAACGDEESTSTTTASPSTDGSTETTGVTETTVAADPLGEPTPATGDTFKVGYMWAGVSASGDQTADHESSEAVTKWINEYMGGIGDGRKLELVDCPAPDPATAAACGSTLIESGVEIVLFNVIGDIQPWAAPVMAAGIPIFGFQASDTSLMAGAGHVFVMSNATVSLVEGPLAVAKQAEAKRAAIVVIDVPGASGPVNALAPSQFEAAGIELDIVPISPTAPDHASSIQTELQNNPDAVWIIGNPAFCSLSIRALRDADYAGAIGGISNCIDAAMLEQFSNGELKDFLTSYAAGEDPANADYALFVNILAKYSPDTAPHGTPVGSFVVIEAFRRFMADYTGDYSAADLTSWIAGHPAVDQPTVDGGKLLCDGTAHKVVAIACTSNFVLATLDEKGQPVSFTGG